MFENVKKSIRERLPGIRYFKSNSGFNTFMTQYGWSFRKANKPLGDWDVYYQAGNNVYVYRSIQVIIDTLLGCGFDINNLEDTEIDKARRNYLRNVFNAPEGYNNEMTFAMFHSQYIRSLELTGDSFIEVNTDKAFDDILTGFRFIPPELIKWYEDTEQWGYRTADIRYEQDELIHIYEPSISLKSSKWGMSKVDKIGLAVALMFQGMQYNRKVLENDGIDPKAILSFDKDLDDFAFNAEIERINAQRAKGDKGGMLAIKGATFESAAASNRDMDWNNLIDRCRDMIITVYGVQPSKVGVRETASLGSGTGKSQDKDFKDVLLGREALIEGAFNKALGRNGFREVFGYNDLDIEDKLNRANIENIQVRNGILSINEVRSSYGLEPVDWGNVPMNYSQFGIASNSNAISNVQSLAEKQNKTMTQVKELKDLVYGTDVLDGFDW